MLKGLYIPGDSFLHRMDPRVKIIMTLALFSAGSMLKTQIYLLVGLLVMLWVLAVLSKTAAKLAKLRGVFLIISFTSIVSWVIFGSRSEHLWWIIYKEPLGYGISAALRSVMCISAAMLFLLYTTRNEEIAAGCVKLGLPYKGAFAFSSALRQAPVILGVVQTVIAAQKSRGLDVESGSLMTRLKKYAPMLAPAFLLTMRQSDQFSQATLSKGFDSPVDKRTSYIQLKLKTSDYIWLGAALVIFVGSILASVFQWCAVFTAVK